MARKFLYFIAFLIILAIAGAFVLNIWSKEITEAVFVPREEFVEHGRALQGAAELIQRRAPRASLIAAEVLVHAVAHSGQGHLVNINGEPMRVVAEPP